MINIQQQEQCWIVTLNARSINPLSARWQEALQHLLEQLEQLAASAQTGAIVQIKFDASTPDYQLEQLAALGRAQAAACMQRLASYQQLLRRLERLSIPVLAILQGQVLGHAWGLALACHRRYASGAGQFGLPQATLGLMPCGGALVRTGRLLGLQAALPLLLDGTALDNASALKLGLLHGTIADASALSDVLAAEAAAAVAPVQPWDSAATSLPGGALNTAANQAFLQLAPARLRARHPQDVPAEQAILCALAEGMQVDFDTAVLIESRYFCQTAIEFQG